MRHTVISLLYMGNLLCQKENSTFNVKHKVLLNVTLHLHFFLKTTGVQQMVEVSIQTLSLILQE